MAAEIATRMRELGRSSALRVGPPQPAPMRAASPLAAILKRRRQGLILLGASVGGTQAIEAILMRLPAEAPPVVIVQHMPRLFTKALAEYLDKVCLMRSSNRPAKSDSNAASPTLRPATGISRSSSTVPR
jgi:two-component system chemotaxis response regulator CheB